MTNPTASATLPSVTDLELTAIRAIAESEYQDDAPTGAGIVGHSVYCCADYIGGNGLNERNIAGVLSSLSKKGLATFADCKYEGLPTCALTATGHAVYLANRE